MERQAGPAIYALTAQGVELALRLRAGLGGVCFAPRALAEKAEQGVQGFDSLPLLVKEQFSRFGGHIFIAAAGIAVRCIAPLLTHKAVDAAVVVLDHKGEYVISLLSGHLGGANELARQVAAVTGGRAVITTATDTEGLPAVDLLALRAGLHVRNPIAIRAANAALLAGKKVGLHDPEGWLRSRLTDPEREYFYILADDAALAAFCATDAAPYVRVTFSAAAQPDNCLALIPPALGLGIGCRKGVAAREVLDLVHKVCAENDLALEAVNCLASADIKAEEAGLVEAARILGVPLLTFSAAELAAYPPRQVSPKAAAALGLPGVCEPAARCASKGGSLLVGKHTSGRVTLAVAKQDPARSGQ